MVDLSDLNKGPFSTLTDRTENLGSNHVWDGTWGDATREMDTVLPIWCSFGLIARAGKIPPSRGRYGKQLVRPERRFNPLKVPKSLQAPWCFQG